MDGKNAYGDAQYTIGILLVLVLTLLAFLGVKASPSLSSTHTVSCSDCNVLLIMIDTLSAEHLKAYGYERDTMPRTEAFFRKNGTTFINAFSQASWTLPSFLSLFFSDLPSQITFADIEGTRPRLQSELRTAGMQVNGLILPPFYFVTEGIARNFKPGETTDLNDEGEENLPALQKVFARWVDEKERTGKPFFGFVHSALPHDPYDPEGLYAEMFDSTTEYPIVNGADILLADKEEPNQTKANIFSLRYDQEIRETDDLLGDFFDALSPEELATTMIIVSSDHGEAFEQHGVYWHGKTLYDELLRVPLFVYVPGGRAGVIIQENVSLLDMSPTVLDVIDAPIPAQFKGVSLKQTIYTGEEPPEQIITHENGTPFFVQGKPLETEKTGAFATLENTRSLGSPEPIINAVMRSARFGHLKLIQHEAGEELYNITTDPKEEHNIIDATEQMTVADRVLVEILRGQLAPSGL
jgi:arylsulfatase A-like enzyme